jgi:hypothetical protein
MVLTGHKNISGEEPQKVTGVIGRDRIPDQEAIQRDHTLAQTAGAPGQKMRWGIGAADPDNRSDAIILVGSVPCQVTEGDWATGELACMQQIHLVRT